MSTVGRAFNRVAEIICARVPQLLYAPVAVTDAKGQIVACSEPELAGHKYDELTDGRLPDYLRVPLRVYGQSGEIIVGKPRPSDQKPISRRLGRVLVELMVNESIVLDRVNSRNELKSNLILNLLNGSIDDEAGVMRQARIVGMDLTSPRVVILIDASDYIMPRRENADQDEAAPTEQQRAQQVIDNVIQFFHLPNDVICCYIGTGQIVVLKEARSDSPAALRDRAGRLLSQLQQNLRASIHISIGHYHPEIRGLSASYQDAQSALSLGRRLPLANQVYCLDNLAYALVGESSAETKSELVDHLLGPLESEPDLRMTLEIFFQMNCSLTACAQQLSIQAIELDRRLDRVASLTGLDPRHFSDAVEIYLALLLRSYQKEAVSGDTQAQK